MLPALCLALFGLFVLLLLLVLIPILGAAFKDDVKKAIEEEAQKNQEEANTSVAVVLIVSWVFIAICAGLFRCITSSSLPALPRFNANSFFPLSLSRFVGFRSGRMACFMCYVFIV